MMIVSLLGIALVYPISTVFLQSVTDQGVFTLSHWTTLLAKPAFREMIGNSFLVVGLAALSSALIAFFAAYGLTVTNIDPKVKRVMHIVLLLPLFLPSITYGFAVIYSFGCMGLVTQLLGQLPFSIYGFWGLLIADVIYTLPAAFLVLYNAFRYVDRRYAIVSRVMGDKPWRTFWQTAVRPTLGTFVSAFVLAFFLAFTDFGIPISIAGEYEVIATALYATMMGAIPNFGQGAVIAITMLIPSAAAVLLLKRADRLNFRYNQLSDTPPIENRVRDAAFIVFFAAIGFLLLAVFAVIFVVPFVEFWPYKPNFTLEHVKAALMSDDLWPSPHTQRRLLFHGQSQRSAAGSGRGRVCARQSRSRHSRRRDRQRLADSRVEGRQTHRHATGSQASSASRHALPTTLRDVAQRRFSRIARMKTVAKIKTIPIASGIVKAVPRSVTDITTAVSGSNAPRMAVTDGGT